MLSFHHPLATLALFAHIIILLCLLPVLPLYRVKQIQLRPNIFTLTPIDVATAIAAAKQASASVLIAQQQVQAAKENVLLQQRIAAEKESQAEILRQKSESAAAIQRSEAAAAAQGVSIRF